MVKSGSQGHLQRFTDNIQRTLKANLYERAFYLRSLYSQISNGSVIKERYLDIGAGETVNSIVFGEDFTQIYCLDIKLPKSTPMSKRWSNIRYIIANAQQLPFADSSFDLVSMFSVIEHMRDRELAAQEALRVLREGGDLVMQFPNRHFPLDLHTGLLNPVFVPAFARKTLLTPLGYKRLLNEVDIPQMKEVHQWLEDSAKLLGVDKVLYSAELVPQRVRGIYRLAKKFRFLHVMPLGYLCVWRKVK